MSHNMNRHVLASYFRQRFEMGEKISFIHGNKEVSDIKEKSPAVQIKTVEIQLRQFAEEIAGCQLCPLGKTRTNLVFGTGNPAAEILFIGEAPGKYEDLQGKPFVGRAGELLNKMIAAIKLRRDEVYIANILKCRPPGNRDPLPSEIECCEPHLLRQIDIIKPIIICALGRISAQTLMRTKAPLKELRGKIHDYHGTRLMVTYHPAALLRNPVQKKPAWDDLKRLRRELDGTIL